MTVFKAIRTLRRDYDITLRDVIKSTKALTENGVLTAGCDGTCTIDDAELLAAALIQDGVLHDQVGADFDWSKLLELLIQILPLILALFL